MSAYIEITADDCRDLGYFLSGLTRLTRDLGVRVGVHDPASIAKDAWDGTTLTLRWDDERGYYIGDAVGF